MRNQIQRFIGGDRYQFDFVLCSSAKGFAQVDTRNDASYYGNWVNPESRRFITFAEGDYTETEFNNDEEMIAWFVTLFTRPDSEFRGIDAGLHDGPLHAAVQAHGLAPFLHQAPPQAGINTATRTD